MPTAPPLCFCDPRYPYNARLGSFELWLSDEPERLAGSTSGYRCANDAKITTEADCKRAMKALQKLPGLGVWVQLADSTKRCKEETLITTAAECQEAATKLGLGTIEDRSGLASGYVHHFQNGCSIYTPGSKVFFKSTSQPGGDKCGAWNKDINLIANDGGNVSVSKGASPPLPPSHTLHLLTHPHLLPQRGTDNRWLRAALPPPPNPPTVIPLRAFLTYWLTCVLTSFTS